MTAAVPFPVTPRLTELISLISRVADIDKLQAVLGKILVAASTPGAPFFSPDEEDQMADAFGFSPAAGVDTTQPSGRAAARALVEGSAYLFETAAYYNMKTAAFGSALLQLGLPEAHAVAFGSVWTAGSGAAISRLKAAPLGAPLVLLGSSYRVALRVGSSAFTGVADATAVLDLALGRPRHAPLRGDDAGAGGAAEEVVSIELDRAALAGLLERLDAVQLQLDTLS